jgi:hypothetical protein
LYVDGVLVSTGVACTDAIDQRFRYIGGYVAGIYTYGSGLQGTIDEVMFFKKELSSADVTILFNASGKVVG